MRQNGLAGKRLLHDVQLFPFGPERYETVENHAEEIVVEELKRRRWRSGELEKRRKGDSGKLAIAVRLRAETEVTVKWIADRLLMGTPG